MMAEMVIPEKVSKVIVIRHKAQSSSEERVTNFANKIKEDYVEEGCKVALISSHVGRAKSTAKPFSEVFGINHHINAVLLSEDYYDVKGDRPAQAIEAISAVAKEEDADMVIIVTHFEWTECLPRFIKIDRFGENERYQFGNRVLDYLSARIINLQDPETKDVLI